MKTLVLCYTCKNDFREYFRGEPLTGFCKKHCKNYHLQNVIECSEWEPKRI